VAFNAVSYLKFVLSAGTERIKLVSVLLILRHSRELQCPLILSATTGMLCLKLMIVFMRLPSIVMLQFLSDFAVSETVRVLSL